MRPRAQHALKLSEELKELARRFETESVTLGEVVETLGERATGLLLVLISLPFMLPIPLPGLSMVFGLVAFLLAVGFVAGRPPWIPQRLRRSRLPPRFFPRLLSAGGRVISWMERRLRPRAQWTLSSPRRQRAHGVVMIVCAILLMLPLPPFPPFTNGLPAMVIVLMTLSLIEGDGVGVIAAYVLFVVTVAYFLAIAFFGTVIARFCWDYAVQHGLTEYRWLRWMFTQPPPPAAP